MKQQIEISRNPDAGAQEWRDKAEDQASLALETLHVVDAKLAEMINAVAGMAHLWPLLRDLTEAHATLADAQGHMLAILEAEAE